MVSQHQHRDARGGTNANGVARDVNDVRDVNTSTRHEIRTAYAANESNEIHGRSSGSGCCIIRLRGQDAASVRGLVEFADDFFEGVDDDGKFMYLKFYDTHL